MLSSMHRASVVYYCGADSSGKGGADGGQHAASFRRWLV